MPPRHLPDLLKTVQQRITDSEGRALAAAITAPLLLLGCSLSGSAVTQTVPLPAAREARAVDISPVTFVPSSIRPLSAQAALAINRSIPISSEPVIAAPPFHFAGGAAVRARALQCLTAAVYYEAGNQGEEGEEAVAQVVLNRVRHPAFPSSVCTVVFQGSTLPSRGCQFTFACDGSLTRVPDRKGWAAAEQVAQRALSGEVYDRVGLSTHYHADYVVPYWATSLAKTAQVGQHIFYHLPSSLGDFRPVARRYEGHEPDPAVLDAAALMTRGLWPPKIDPATTPAIALTADPQLQLVGVVGLLGSPDRSGASRYESDVKSYFTSASNDPAVQLFRDAATRTSASAKPQTKSSFADVLTDFAATTDSRAFLRSHLAYYRSSISMLGRALAPAIDEWQEYSAMPLPAIDLTVGIGPSDDLSICAARKLLGREAIWLYDPGETDSSEDLFIKSGAYAGAFRSVAAGEGPDEPMSASLQEQVARAVFARIVALSSGEDAGTQAVRSEAEHGYTLVPELAARLEDYERHRDDYPTLRDFLPVLVRGLSDQQASASTGEGESSSPTGCNPAPLMMVDAGTRMNTVDLAK